MIEIFLIEAVAILGYAFPKLVGRLLSLRLPDSLPVFWLTPQSGYDWLIGPGGPEATPLSVQLGGWSDDEWESERLVTRIEDGDETPAREFVKQVLHAGAAPGRRKFTDFIPVAAQDWRDRIVRSIRLAEREVALTAGVEAQAADSEGPNVEVIRDDDGGRKDVRWMV